MERFEKVELLELDKVVLTESLERSIVGRRAAEEANAAFRAGVAELLVDAHKRRVAVEKERDALLEAIRRHRSQLSGGPPAAQDAQLWRSAGIST